MAWQELSITAGPEQVELFSDILNGSGALSVTYQDAGDQPVYEPEPGKTDVWQCTTVTGLFEEGLDLTSLQVRLKNEFNVESELTRLEEQIWERTWLDHFQPMNFGERLSICPTGQSVEEPDRVILTLDPGLAFGTGTHPTTALCLEWLDSQMLNDKTVIDYGCGSGILAIAALLLGAKQAICVDIDPQALTATMENATKNGVADRISCYLPEQFKTQQADFVLANILATPLISLSKEINELVAPAGKIVLSGILKEQTEEVSEVYRPLFQLEKPVFREEWARISGKRLDC